MVPKVDEFDSMVLDSSYQKHFNLKQKSMLLINRTYECPLEKVFQPNLSNLVGNMRTM